ncbi:MAG: hypothetical protein F6K19_32550 [Cyanothece sp. SIO1E1]|nr:hypothetical protein [Cyanothece sp. SIO1E1]
MKSLLKGTLIPGLIATGILSATLLPAKPAAAGFLRDIGIGAGTGLVTGEIFGNDSSVDDTINGAAAGAAVNATDRKFRKEGGRRNAGRDVGVGAAAAGATGIITNNNSFVENAAQGALTGGIINLVD